MKQLVVGGTTFLTGDDAADTVIDYTAVLAKGASADTVELRARTVDGRDVMVYFTLNSAVAVLAMTTPEKGPEPDNQSTVTRMRQAIHRLDPRIESYFWNDRGDSDAGEFLDDTQIV